jgi:hypothetical protein
VEKPVFIVVTSYVPGGTSGTMYCPCLLETVVRVLFVAESVTVMVAPVIKAPLGSVTVPMIVPLLVAWPKARPALRGVKARRSVVQATRSSRLKLAFFIKFLVFVRVFCRWEVE